MNNAKVAVDKARQVLTDKQGAFVRALVEDPSNATAAAIKAGYSPRSAKFIAHRLLKNEQIQSILAQHFIDKEQEVSDLLDMSLVELAQQVKGSATVTRMTKSGDVVEIPIGPDSRLKAVKVALQYAKIAKDVLGLKVDKKPELPDEKPMTREELIAAHEAELNRLKSTAPATGEGALH